MRRIFRGPAGRGGNHKRSKKHHDHPDDVPSIGSALSSRDQFEIVVIKKKIEDVPPPRSKKNKSNVFSSIFSYDGSDSSTVSSITAYDRAFQQTSHSTNRGSSVGTSSTMSWCCCTDTTSTNEDATNTLMMSRTRSFAASTQAAASHYVPTSENWSTAPAVKPGSERRGTFLRRNRQAQQQRPAIKSDRSLFDNLSDDENDHLNNKRKLRRVFSFKRNYG
jgi:hypothetical protein